MNFLVIVLIIAILFALATGLIGLLKGGEKGSDKLFKSLVTRVGLSVSLFVLLMFAGYMGWIEPNSITAL
ncbi:MAG: twin transmembrane helix small protein [PS1 clade bacterium]